MDLRALDRFARHHHGLVTRDAAEAAGTSERSWYRATQSGQLQLLHPKVARVVGVASTPTQTVCAAVLAAGPGAMASHRSAAWLWGVPCDPDDPVDVLLPSRTRKASVISGAVVHRPRDHLDLRPVWRNAIPTTNILRTLCDLGAVDSLMVPGAVGRVVTTGLASPAALWRAIARHSRQGRPGVPALWAALLEWVLDGKPVGSILEPAMRRLLERHGRPPASSTPWLAATRSTSGSSVVRSFSNAMVGRHTGLDRDTFERDRTKDAELAAAGFVVLRFTYRAILRRPGREADRIRRNVVRWAPHLLEPDRYGARDAAPAG